MNDAALPHDNRRSIQIPRIGRDEMNLAEFPLAFLGKKAPAGRKTLWFRDDHGVTTVTGTDAFGLPTAFDIDVIIGCVQLTRSRTNFQSPEVPFTRYELIRLLRLPDATRYYHRTEQSLRMWTGVTLDFRGNWWDNSTKSYASATIHIIDSVIIREKAPARGQIPMALSTFTWNKKFIESCQADNLKRLDLGIYFSLDSSIARRMYRFLDKRFYLDGEWLFDLKTFAFEYVGLSRSYKDAGKLKEKLQPAVEELEAIGFLEPLPRDVRYKKRGKDWIIRLVRPKAKVIAIARPAEVERDQPEAEADSRRKRPDGLAGELVDLGVSARRAKALVQDHPDGFIRGKLDLVSWMREAEPESVANPAGFLVKAIEEDYAPPKGYKPKAEREAEAKRAAAARKQQEEKQRRAAEQERRRAEEAAQEKENARRADDYWESLCPAEQEDLDRRAEAAADEETLKTYRGMPRARIKATYFKAAIRNPYIRTLLPATAD